MSSVQTATKEIERIAEKANGVVGVFAHHLESNQTLTFNPNEPFPMASTYKIGMAIKLLQHIEKGELALDQMVELTPEDLSPGSGMITPHLPHPGLALSIYNLLETMMLPPHLAKLVQPNGDSSPTSLLWILMGSSAAYSAFTGAVETLGGVLLFNRRTTTLGALISLGVLAAGRRQARSLRPVGRRLDRCPTETGRRVQVPSAEQRFSLDSALSVLSVTGGNEAQVI